MKSDLEKRKLRKKIGNKQNIWKEIRFDAFTHILVSLSIVRKKKNKVGISKLG